MIKNAPLIAGLALVLMTSSAMAQSQSVGNENASTSAVIIEGSDVDSPSDTQTLRTNPDISAPPVMTAVDSCFVGQGSVGIGSYLFGGLSGSKTKLDEGCEARADSAHFANLAATQEAFGNTDKAETLLRVSVLRMGLSREEYLEKAAAANADTRAWSDLFRVD